MNKRGQVFLMAAIIIAGIMFSLIRISNKGTAKEEPEAFYDLADEIDFEIKRVLDYGTLNSPSIIGDLTAQLLSNYSEYISNEDVVFVYGDTNQVYAYYYRTVDTIAITILNNTFIPLRIVTNNPIEARHSGNTATVRINGIDYDFDLKPGQNFYFILIKEDEGEEFVKVK